MHEPLSRIGCVRIERTQHYKCGAVFSVDIRVAGRRIYHLGSADFLEGMMDRNVDLLLMCVAGWTTTERFAPRAMGSFRPGSVLLSHWDAFISPMERGAHALPAMRMPSLVDKLTAIDPSVKVGNEGRMPTRTLCTSAPSPQTAPRMPKVPPSITP